jgi:serine/threonine protein phosphatase PrpC
MGGVQTALAFRSYRAATEDRAAVVPLPAHGGVVIVVADGVGGRPRGGRAAHIAVKRISEAATAVSKPLDPETWRDLLFDVDQALNADAEAGETTAVIVAVTAEGIAGASVGDSEAWLVSAAGHSVLTSRQQRKPYLGYGAAIPVGFRPVPLEGTLLVATDGLFKYMDAERIAAAVRGDDLEAAAEAVAEIPRNREGSFYDDLAVVLCRRFRTSSPSESPGGGRA